MAATRASCGTPPATASRKTVAFEGISFSSPSPADSINQPSGCEAEEEEAGNTSKQPLLSEKSRGPKYGGLRRKSSTAGLAVSRAFLTRQRLWSSVVSCLVAAIPGILTGYTLGFPSSALLDLTGEAEDRLPSEYRFNSTLSQLFAALALIGAMVGAPLGGYIADHWGRKPSLLFCGAPYLTGYLMISYAHYLPTPTAFKTVLLAGRLVVGVGLGWGTSVAPVYIAEVSAAKFRGVFGSLTQIGLSFGVMLNYAVGSIPGVLYYYNSLVAAAIVAAFVVPMALLRETPRWLVAKGHYHQARQTLLWLRGSQLDIETEMSCGGKQPAESTNLWTVLKQFSKRSVTVPVLIMMGVMVFVQIGGINAISSYSASLYETAGVPNPRVTATYSVGGVQLLATFVTVVAVDISGRKLLLIVSGVGTTIASVMLGVHFYITRPSLCSPPNSTLSNINMADLLLQDSPTTTTPCNTQYAPLAIISVVIFGAFFSIGWGPVPWVLLSEIIPLQVRGFASGLAVLINWAAAALVVGFYLEFVEAVGVWFAWWSFALINAVGVVFVLVLIKETRGKTLEEIEKYYQDHWF